ncbi:MAG: DUF433 domain-containing protein [Chloroflexi bacterium]|nr:DUF433 domain-containing protein [Chloroflexota bacterium]
MTAAPKVASPWRIGRNPAIGGGEPIVEGTRIPVSAIVATWHSYGDMDRVLSAYPRLDREAIQCALSYYHRHRDEIDRLIEESEQAAYATE